jgi:probable HAF family extracellular repeat protein
MLQQEKKGYLMSIGKVHILGILRRIAKKFWFYALFAVLPLAANAAAQYSVIDLGAAAGNAASSGIWVYGINASGAVLGSMSSGCFTYDHGVFKNVGTIPGDAPACSPASINAVEQVTGGSWDRDYTYRAFLYTNGTTIAIGTLSGNTSFGYGINDFGEVTGLATLSGGVTHAFLYSNNVMKDIDAAGVYSAGLAINNRGWIAGTYHAGADNSAFMYRDGVMHDISMSSGWHTCYGRAINNDGQVAGNGYNPLGYVRAFLYVNDKMKDLGALGGSLSSGYGINDFRDVVGEGETPEGRMHAFLYSQNKMIDLNSRIDQTLGIVLNSALAINNRGEIIAKGFSTRTPEIPDAFILIPK